MNYAKLHKRVPHLILTIMLSITNTVYSNQLAKEQPHNKTQFDDVIKHYSKNPKDSLKRKAAIFLISNIEPHFSFYSTPWHSLCRSIDSINIHITNDKQYKHCYDSIFAQYENKLNDYEVIYDNKKITAKYLINNIDSAFNLYKLPHCKKLPFKQFCEFILPYRLGNEQIVNWRSKLYKQFYPVYSKTFQNYIDSTSAKDFCELLKTSIKAKMYDYPYPTPNFDPLVLSRLKLGNCHDYSTLISIIGRSFGIPIALDFVPQWAAKSGSHEWNALIYPNKKPLDFGIGDKFKLGHHLESNPLWIAPKIYRYTYSVNKESLAYIHEKEEIPELFLDSCFIDVTPDYIKTYDINSKLTLNLKTPCKYAYLAVFNNYDWTPIQWAKIENQTTKFKAMNKGIVYLPVYFHNNNIQPAAYPILFRDSANITELKPNTKIPQDVVLKRKYNDANVLVYNKRLKGGRFQVANKIDFSDAIDIYIIKSFSDNCFQTAKIENDGTYKFFRYLTPPNSLADMAEIEVYDSNNIKLEGKVIGGTNNGDKRNYDAAFDGSVLSYLKVLKGEDTWAGLEFQKPVQINKVIYLPRNDDNFIRNKQIYELFYWDNRWVSLGKQTGAIETQSLIYNNAPTNALFILRNLSSGSEERIFTYENGKQVWW